MLRRGDHYNPVLQAAWLKYGGTTFELLILEESEPEALLQRETYFVDLLQPEYNISLVNRGSLGHTQSKETREKIRRARLGKRHTRKARRLMSESAKDRGIPESTREAQRRAVTGRPRSVAACRAIAQGKLGKKASRAHRKAVSAGLRRWWQKRRKIRS